MYEIAVIVGSLRKASLNKRFAKVLEEIGKDLFKFNIIPLDEVPLFNQDIEGNPGEAVLHLRKSVEEADAVLFLTPEYNRSMSAVMKNAVDWCSRPYGKFALMGKPAATAGVSVGSMGTVCAQQELRRILVMLTMKVMGQPEVYVHGSDKLFPAEGGVTNDDSKAFFRRFLEAFKKWIDDIKN